MKLTRVPPSYAHLTMTERQGSKIVARSTKLIVRNVAFEATEKELKELFSAFGQIKTIRMPRKKFASTHRG